MKHLKKPASPHLIKSKKHRHCCSVATYIYYCGQDGKYFVETKSVSKMTQGSVSVYC